MMDFLELTQGLIESNNFEEAEYTPLEKGEYRIKVISVDKKDSQSGNEYLAMVLEVIDGENNGKKIYYNTHFTVKTAESSIKRIYNIASLCEIAPKAFSDVSSIVEYAKSFIDKCFLVNYDSDAFNQAKFLEEL